MNVRFERRFAKDLRNLSDKKLLSKAKEIIAECKSADSVSDIKSIKKLQGYESFYRIRIGDYRVGVEFIDNALVFVRLLHRKDVYKYFP